MLKPIIHWLWLPALLVALLAIGTRFPETAEGVAVAVLLLAPVAYGGKIIAEDWGRR